MDSWFSMVDYVVIILGFIFAICYYVYSQGEKKPPQLVSTFKPIVTAQATTDFGSSGFVARLKASGKNIVVFYGSQTGTAEDLAFRLAKDAPRYGMKALALDPEECDMEELHLLSELPNSLAVFCLATYGEGDPTDNARELYDFLQREEADLTGINYAVFGLGNKTYEHFNQMGKFANKQLKKLGATMIMDLGLGDDDGNLEEDFMLWRENFWLAVCKHFNVTSIGEDVSIREYKLTVYGKDAPVDCFTGEVARLHSYSVQKLPFHQKNPFLAAIVTSRNLHRAGDRQCLHIEFSLVGSRLRYECGDHLAVYPENDAKLVEKFGDILGVDLDVVVSLTNVDPDSNKRNPFPCPCSYRTALTFYLDITTPPRMNVIKELVQHCSAAEEKEFLSSMVVMSEEGRKKYLSWVVEDRRTIINVMEDLPSCRPPLDLLLELLPRLQPRYYSISSSPKVDANIVSITAVVLRYTTPIGRPGKGVATNYLLSKRVLEDQPSPKVPIFIRRSQFRLPSSPSVPVIMIGPGTGMAPFRGFIQERAALKQSGKEVGPTVLYFGCRSRHEDYLYSDELEAWHDDGILTELHVAFSRDQAHKVYVQHLISQNSVSVWESLQQGASVYVCGDARNMARDVHSTLIRVISEEGRMSMDEAAAYIKRMEAQKRYQADVWSV